MDRVVVDSSVMVKLFLDEAYSEKAYALRDSFISKNIEITVSSILPYEMLNALRYSGGYSEKELVDISLVIIGYNFSTVDVDALFLENLVKIAEKYDITVYDASYVVSAIMSKSTFYTADQKLIDAVRLPFVKHIKDY